MYVEKMVRLKVRHPVRGWRETVATKMKVYANGTAEVVTPSGTMKLPPISWRRL